MNKAELKEALKEKIKNSATTYEVIFHAMSMLIDILVEDDMGNDKAIKINKDELNVSN
jgi:hypothetical protein